MTLNDLTISEIELSLEETSSIIGGDGPKVDTLKWTQKVPDNSIGDSGSGSPSTYTQRTGCDGHDPVGCDERMMND